MITVTDQFAGCGGSSQGAKKVRNVEVKLAMNHWPLAVESHNTNHPNADHDCADVSNTHPGRYRRTNILISSPECTNHSLSAGKRRKNLNQGDLFKQEMIDPSVIRSRATMWDVVRFTEHHRYDNVIVENVVDVRLWALFEPWLKAMHNLGYKHKCVYLNAMFVHGPDITGFDPQSRDRIYIVFWKKRNPAPDLDFRPQAPCPRCGIIEAVQCWKNGRVSGKYKAQYVYNCSGCGTTVTPFYYAALNAVDLSIPMVRIGDREKYGMKKLVANTINRIEYGLKKFGLRPTLLDQRNSSGNVSARIRSADSDVLNCQSTGYSSYLFSPFMFNFAHTACNPEYYTYGMDQHLPTLTTREEIGLVSPFVMAQRKNATAKEMRDALPTVTTRSNDLMLIDPSQAFMSVSRGKSKAHEATGAMTTVSSGGIHSGIVIPPSAILTMRGERNFKGMEDPLVTQVAAGIQSYIVAKTPFLTPYHGSNQAGLPTDAMSTIPTGDSLAYIEAGQQPDVEDCFFRMLQPSETAIAQGFPSDYIILGNKEEKQRQIGNANPPPTMELLVAKCAASLGN